MMNKIGFKLTASYILIIVAATLILGIFFAGSARRFLFAEKERELIRKGAQLGQTVIDLFTGEMPPTTAERILEVTGNYLEAKIMVVDTAGKRLAMTPGIRRRGAYLSRADFAHVISGKTIVRRGYNAILEVDAIFVGTPVKIKSGQIAGAVFLIAPITVVGRLIDGLWQIGTLAALIGIVFSLLLAVYLSRTISLPIIKLKEAAVAMAEGNFQIKVRPRPDEIGDLGKAFNVMAERLGKSMDALKREKHKIERILANLAEGVLAVGADKKIMFINNKAQELLGLNLPFNSLAEGDAEANGYRDLSMIKEIPLLYDLINTVGQTREPQSTEINLHSKMTILTHASPLLDGELLSGIIVVFQDITALRRVEILRKQLVADLSHELRAPLTIIRGQTEALLDGVIEREEEKRKYLRDILAETVRLSEMVRALLDIAHLDSGAKALKKSNFCLKSLISSLAEKYHAIASEKKIDLKTEFQARKEFVMVYTDETRIEQVIRNLLDNAIRYTPPEGEILIRLREQDTCVSVEVVDNGPGIPQDEQPMIWERFYKVNKARTAGEGGMGLGLAIAKEIILAAGGEIWVESEKGKGATFGFSIPVQNTEV